MVRGSLIISRKVKNGKGVNLSNGKFINFISLAQKILALLGKKGVKVKGNSNKPEGVFARGGSTIIQRKYGFIPKISLKEGINEAIQYFKKY